MLGILALSFIAGPLFLAATAAPCDPPETREPGTVKVVAANDLASLGIDDLIKRLPPAGQEWRWDRGESKGVEHPASLEMRRRVVADGLTDEQWQKALLESGAIRLRSRWPRAEEYRASLTVPRWLGLTQIRLTPRMEGGRTIAAGELMWSFSGTFPAMRARDARLGNSMGVIPEGTTELVFDVEVERGRAGRMFREDEGEAPPPGMLWSGTLSLPIQLVDSFAEAIPPVQGEELDGAVRDAIGAGFRRWGKEDEVGFVLVDPDCDRFPILKTTGLDLKVELLQSNEALMRGEQLLEGKLVASDADLMTTLSSVRTGSHRFYGSMNVGIARPADTTKWHIRITGGSDHLWALWHAKQRWAGSITIPWDEAVEKEVGVDRGPEISTPYMK